MKEALLSSVAKEIGPMVKPNDIRFSETLRTTLSGKIRRRLLNEVAAGGEVIGGTTTLEDPNVIVRLRKYD